MNESFITKVIEGYRITIPKQIREKLGITESDWIEAVIIRKIEKSVAPQEQKESKIQ